MTSPTPRYNGPLPLPQSSETVLIGYGAPFYEGSTSVVSVRKSALAWIGTTYTGRMREGFDPNNVDPAVDIIMQTNVIGWTNGGAAILLDLFDGDQVAARQWMIDHANEWLG